MAAQHVLDGLVNTSAPEVKGAHDAEMVIDHGRAYIVSEANEVRAGEAAAWPFIYATMSVVDFSTLKVEKIIPVAKSEQAFENETLPVGACFVPRILKKDAHTLRVFFASEAPGLRQSQTWYRDFDLERDAFENKIHKVRLKTAAGVFDMQPQPFYDDAVAHGFQGAPKDFGLYLFDPIKIFDGKHYAAINNYAAGHEALAVLNTAMDTFEVVGHFYGAPGIKLTEPAVNRLPDGMWMAISRQEGGDQNYQFSTSRDGVQWTALGPRAFVSNGAASRPTFDRFHGIYFLGWQEKTRINNVSRSVFNLDVSRDGEHWERKYRFETEKSFQYPTFREANGSIYLTVTQGDNDPSRKERIMFGKLE